MDYAKDDVSVIIYIIDKVINCSKLPKLYERRGRDKLPLNRTKYTF